MENNDIVHQRILFIECPKCKAKLDWVDLYRSIVRLNSEFPGIILKRNNAVNSNNYSYNKNDIFAEFVRDKKRIRKLASCFNYALLESTVKTENG